MLNYFHDLKDESKLPPGSRFLDPYDHTPFVPETGETLSNFIERTSAHRTARNLPTIPQDELRQLIVSSLFESTEKRHQLIFFEKRAIPATFNQITSLAKTIAQEVIHSNNVTALQRQDRAKKCHECSFHKPHSSWSTKTTDLIAKFAGLANVHTSNVEKALGTCTMCGGCALQPKVRFTLLPILAGLTPERLDTLIRTYRSNSFSKCWITSEALNNGITRDLLRKKLAAGHADGNLMLDAYLANKLAEAKSQSTNKVEAQDGTS